MFRFVCSGKIFHPYQMRPLSISNPQLIRAIVCLRDLRRPFAPLLFALIWGSIQLSIGHHPSLGTSDDTKGTTKHVCLSVCMSTGVVRETRVCTHTKSKLSLRARAKLPYESSSRLISNLDTNILNPPLLTRWSGRN